MRIGIISDIHGNFTALEAVLHALGTVDQLWCLGDLVGYGGQPNECVECIRERTTHVLRGNHDLAALGLLTTEEFNATAAAAAQWTGEQLTQENRAFLEFLPEMKVEMQRYTLAHGTPRDPIWEYLLNGMQAIENLHLIDTPMCFVGHSHVPLYFNEKGQGGIAGDGKTVSHQTLKFERIIANPGSVGQPRDQNPLAAYLVLDTFPMKLTWHRVAYDIAEAQGHILRAGLPAVLANRLAYGK